MTFLIIGIVISFIVSFAFGIYMSKTEKDFGLFIPFSLGALAPLLLLVSVSYLTNSYILS